ncbi:MAG: Hsp70 family protein [Blastocatellia bacterium]|nr:Hsp70 family protein [Blastocatellia bacterium]
MRPASAQSGNRTFRFESLIQPIATKIESAIDECLLSASVTPAQIKRVLLTGGSSQVPLISQTISNKFGAEKIIRPDYFSSIATGLGYVASRITNERNNLS